MEKGRNHCIAGVHVRDRVGHISEVQDIFTEFGCFIKTRIGLHDINDNSCSPGGLIIVEFMGNENEFGKFISQLGDVEGVEVQSMVFKHI